MGKNKKISCQIPIQEYKTIERLVDDGWYKSINDFIQIAIKRLLAEEVDRVELDEKTLKMIKQTLGIKM